MTRHPMIGKQNGTLGTSILIWCAISLTGRAQTTEKIPVSSSEIRPAIRRALALLESTSAQTADARKCFTCHGQAVAVMAAGMAREHGFAIDAKNFHRQLVHTHSHLREGLADYLKGKGQGGQVDTAGYAALTLKVGGWPADDVTAAIVEYLLQYQSNQDHWSSSSNRPPSEASDFSATYVALVTMNAFGTSDQQPRIAKRKRQVKDWLLEAETCDTEDEVFRLLAMNQADVPRPVIAEKIEALLEQQQEDGGWGQNSQMASDAYATATVMAALHLSSKHLVDHPSFQRGIRYLLNQQLADGSWHVVSHSKPFQTYFESGFPHGVDQFISATATGWAILALVPASGSAEEERSD